MNDGACCSTSQTNKESSGAVNKKADRLKKLKELHLRRVNYVCVFHFCVVVCIKT